MNTTTTLVYLTVTACLSFLGVAGSAIAASAETTSEPEPSCTRCPGGTVTSDDDWIEARATERFAGRPGSSGPTRPAATGSSFLAGCDFEFIEAGDDPIGEHSSLGGLVDGVWPVDYWMAFCGGSAIAYTFYADGAPPPVSVIEDMLIDVWQRAPVVHFAPITSPDGDDAISLITQLPTFLWVDEAEWVIPRTAVATLPGGFTVTATATASIAYWSGGDEPADCTIDQMKPYEYGIGGDEAQPSDCAMVYKQSSALGDHSVNVDVIWDVFGTCSDGSCDRPLPPKTTSSTREVIVGEIQAIGRG